jgi:hypothetical protein
MMELRLEDTIRLAMGIRMNNTRNEPIKTKKMVV